MGFGGSFGLVFSREGLYVLLVGLEVVGRQDDDLAGEAVTECVLEMICVYRLPFWGR